MANEFIARKGLKVLSGDLTVTGNIGATQIISGSQISGTFFGNGAGITNVITASFATTSSAATSITFTIATASYALTAGASGGGVTGQGVASRLAVWTNTSTLATSSIDDNGSRISSSLSITASAFQGNGAGITGVITASYAGTDWNAINNKPTVVSSSAQVNSGSFTGSFIGTASYAVSDWGVITNKPTVVSSSTQISYTGITNIPVGIISSSAQTVASIAGQTISPTVVSASGIYTDTITARQFNTQLVSSSIIFQSGSSKFGDTSDDVMNVTGTLSVSGTTTLLGPVTFQSGLQPTVIAGALYSTGSTTANVGTTVVASVSTASYDMANFTYVVKNGLNYRAGHVITVWSASVVEFTDVSTADIGTTTDITFTADVVTGLARLKAVVGATNGWIVKSIINAI